MHPDIALKRYLTHQAGNKAKVLVIARHLSVAAVRARRQVPLIVLPERVRRLDGELRVCLLQLLARRKLFAARWANHVTRWIRIVLAFRAVLPRPARGDTLISKVEIVVL